MKSNASIKIYISLFLLSTYTAFAQDYLSSIKDNIEVAANVHAVYTPKVGAETKAPKGFKPVYISHYGRHGSRFHLSNTTFCGGLNALSKADSLGILSEEGKQLQADMNQLLADHQGLFGELSPRGAREHRGIADRMAAKWKKLFANGGRVRCISSNASRCLSSQANFVTQLQADRPNLEFSFETGDKFFTLLCRDFATAEMKAYMKAFIDSLSDAIVPYEDFYGRIFTDPNKATRELGRPYPIMASIYACACICHCIDDVTDVNLYKYFSLNELAGLSAVIDERFYGQFGNSREWGALSSSAAKELLEDIVFKADNALKSGSDVVADLRFGHDTGLLPLLGLMQIEGEDLYLPIGHSREIWRAYEQIPMASNLQMVFFRNKRGVVLVKLYFNEKETAIKAVPSYAGSYYDWQTLRAYLIERAERCRQGL